MTNAVFMNNMGFEENIGFNDFNNTLNALEVELNFLDAQSMWDYAVYGINLSAALYYKLKALYQAIKGLATDFKINSNHSFDTT